jgi:hypothetical protein
MVMRAAIFGVAAIWVLGTLPGRAQTPAPTYDAAFTVNSSQAVYSGPTTFIVDAKGVVTGTMTLTDPARVNATLNGSVSDGTWTFAYGFTMPDNNNCTGTVTGTGKVAADSKSVGGSVTISGDCVPQPEAATFSFTRRAK